MRHLAQSDGFKKARGHPIKKRAKAPYATLSGRFPTYFIYAGMSFLPILLILILISSNIATKYIYRFLKSYAPRFSRYIVWVGNG